MTNERRGWWMNIADKVEISSERVCPSHHLPHTLPVIGDPVENEPCHYHNNRLRMLHHALFCAYLECPNFKFMTETYKAQKKPKSKA